MFLTRNGKPHAVILVGTRPSWIENHAADELRKYVGMISGAQLPVVANAERAPSVVAVGQPQTNALIEHICRLGLMELPATSPRHDGFVIQTVNLSGTDVLVLSGSQDRGTLYAVYAFLEEALGVGFFRDGERIPHLPTIELPDLDIRERPRFEGRHDGNGCMYLYSAICWQWEDWQRELDWKAKRRQNATYTFYVGGDITPGILRDWGVAGELRPHEPEPYCRLHERALAYARQLGIRVPCAIPLLSVSDAFLQRFPDCRTITADWAGFAPQRWLHPADPRFRRFAVEYVRRYTERYGNDHLYLADFLSEARLLDGESRHQQWLAYARAMSEALREADPDGAWLVQSWPFDMDASTPEHTWTAQQVREYLDAINVPLIVDDIWAEEAEKYKRTGYFGGKPWGFGVLHCFGGHTYLHGDVRDLVARVHDIEESPEPGNCVWFLSVPEIVDYNPFYLELAALLSWNPHAVTVERYVERYCRLRYGDEGGRVFQEVFPDLLDTVYGPRSGSIMFLLDPLYWFRLTPDLYIGSPQYRETVLALRAQRARYIPKLRRVLWTLCGRWQALEGNDLARRDLVDIARQWIAERFSVQIRSALDAFLSGDSAAFEQAAAACLVLLDQQARLLATWPAYRLDVKVERAKAVYGDDACRAIKHAHLWVYPDAGMESASLRDYYRMDLDGLVRDYYRPRVAAYLDVLRKKISANEAALTKAELEAVYSPIEDAFVAAPVEPFPRGESSVAVVRDLLATDRAPDSDH